LLGFEPRPETLQARILGRVRGGLEAVLGLDIDGFVGWLAARWKMLLRGVSYTVGALWALSCVVPIATDQVAVVRVLGRHTATYGPGIALKPWWPIGQATRLRPDQVRFVELGFRRTDPKTRQIATNPQYDWDSAHLSGEYERVTDEAAMLTGDTNFVECQLVVHYTVANAAQFLFAAQEPEQLLRFHAEEALRRVVSETALDTVLTTGRHPIEEATVARLQAVCDASRLGIEIVSIELGDVHPPLEVVPAFRSVASAFENQLQRVNEAEAYANEEVALARGEAAAELENSAAYKQGRVTRSRGDASRFTNRRQAAATGRKVTFDRLYLEAMERVLAGRRKMILDPQATGRRQFWVLEPSVAKALEALGAQPYQVPSPFGEAAEEQEPAPPVEPPAPADAASPTATAKDAAAQQNAGAATPPDANAKPTPAEAPPSLPGLDPTAGSGGGQ
jgi:HflK protein